MKERTFLLLIVAAVVGAGALAFGMGNNVANRDTWSPRQYVVEGSDCWVKPQGDPLYDQKYAQDINTYNCQAYKDQEQAQHIESLTRQTDWNTSESKLGVYSILGVFLGVLALLGFAVMKGSAA